MPQIQRQQEQARELQGTRNQAEQVEGQARKVQKKSKKGQKAGDPKTASNAAYEGRDGNAEKDVRALVKTGSCTADDVIQALYYTTIPQMKKLARSRAFMNQMRNALPDAHSVLRCGLAIHAEPAVIYRQYVLKGGSDQGELKQIISIATSKQIEAILRDPQGKKLPNLFPGTHPDNVLGEDFAAHVRDRSNIFNSEPRLKWFMKWSGKTDQKFDLDGAYQGMSKDQAGLDAALASNPGTWNKVMATSPRGKALNQIGADALDKCVLSLSGLSLPRIRTAFEVRFGSTLDAESAVGSKKDHCKKLWEQMKLLPLEHVTSDTVLSFNVEASGWGGGDYMDHIGGIGTGHSNIGSVESLGATKWETFGETIRHEVGHAVDTKLGGYENFSSQCKAQWRRFYSGSEANFAAHFAGIAAGGNADLAAAAEAFLNGGSVIDWSAACDKAGDVDKVLTGCDKDSCKQALVDVLAQTDVTAADGGANINGYRFRMTWGSDYQSYKVDGEDTANISQYAYNSWAEFFAEVYMHWFQDDGAGGYCEDRKNHGGGGKLPPWVRAAGFAGLVADKEPGRIQNAPKNEEDKKKKARSATA